MKVLAVLAHMDDEALLCGGLLLAARAAGHDLSIVFCTDPRFCNPIANQTAEAMRVKKRVEACYASCKALGTTPDIMLSCPNNMAVGGEDWREMRNAIITDLFHVNPDIIITHGVIDTGHMQHLAVHEAVLDIDGVPPIVFTEKVGDYVLPLNVYEKAKLLDFYRYGTTRTPEWVPSRNPGYDPWTGVIENFSASCDEAGRFLKSLGS